MNKFEVITHKTVKDFIESLDKVRRGRIDRVYFLFEEYGFLIPGKYLKKIADNLWEFRASDIRLFFTIKGSTAYVIHAIYKKTQKTPRNDLDLALKRTREIK